MEIEDKGQAFDWAWALYHFLSHNYGGQGCTMYSCLNRLTLEYELRNVPTIDFENNDCDEYEMAVMYYNELDNHNYQEYFNTFCHYMDNDWERAG